MLVVCWLLEAFAGRALQPHPQDRLVAIGWKTQAVNESEPGVITENERREVQGKLPSPREKDLDQVELHAQQRGPSNSDYDSAGRLREWRQGSRAGSDQLWQCSQEEPLAFIASEYIPSPACARARRTGSLTVEEQRDNACIEDLLFDVAKLQRTNCSSQTVSAQLMPGGFGSVVHLMALQLQRAKKMGRSVVFAGASAYSWCEDQDMSCLWCDDNGCPLASPARCRGNGVRENRGHEAFENVMRAERSHASHEAWAPDDKFGMCFTGANALFRYVSALVGYFFSPSKALVMPCTRCNSKCAVFKI